MDFRLLANLSESDFLSDSSYTYLVLSFTGPFHGLCDFEIFADSSLSIVPLYGLSTYLGWRVIGRSYGLSLLTNLADSDFLSDSSYTHLVLSFTEAFHGLCDFEIFADSSLSIGTLNGSVNLPRLEGHRGVLWEITFGQLGRISFPFRFVIHLLSSFFH